MALSMDLSMVVMLASGFQGGVIKPRPNRLDHTDSTLVRERTMAINRPISTTRPAPQFGDPQSVCRTTTDQSVCLMDQHAISCQDLPGVRELFETEIVPDAPRKTRRGFYLS